MTIRRSPEEWYTIWLDIVKFYKKINRRMLTELSGCSPWTMRALTRDFTFRECYVTFYNDNFYYTAPYTPVKQTLSLTHEERMKLV